MGNGGNRGNEGNEGNRGNQGYRGNDSNDGNGRDITLLVLGAFHGFISYHKSKSCYR